VSQIPDESAVDEDRSHFEPSCDDGGRPSELATEPSATEPAVGEVRSNSKPVGDRPDESGRPIKAKAKGTPFVLRCFWSSYL